MTNFPKNIICETSTVAFGNMSFRAGSKKEVIDNRTNFLAQFGIAYQEHIAMQCDHGEIITIVDGMHTGVGAIEPEDHIKSEVLVTQKKHLALLLLTADCQPISFYDSVTQTIALAHLSRKTVVQKLVQETVGFLHDELGIVPSNLLVHIGPHIRKESYAFELPLQEEALELAPFTEIKDGHAHIDLEQASLAQLTHAGIKKENISVSPIDTGTSMDHYSYFMLKKNNLPDTPRMATILMMR